MNNRKNSKASGRSQITRTLITQYAISLLVFAASYVVLVLLFWGLCRRFTWYSTNPFYRILTFFKEYILFFSGGILLCGWVGITYFYMVKPIRYLDDVILASHLLAAPGDTPITLPQALKSVQDELNLVKEQALRSQMLARESEQRKNDLIVYLAHDLKTPLTSVIGYLTLLQDEPQISQELRARYTGIALTKAERLEELINEFFDITRFSLTNLVLQPERVNVSRMLEQITNEFNPILAEKELSWQIQLPPALEIICDPDKLERVFDNLIRNAVNYSSSQSAIRLYLEQTTDGVQAVIKNQCKAIPKEKLEHIFEQFFRLDSSRAAATGGAGLGLAIAKEIVELHNGRIWAESETGGIAFFVWLPLDCHKIV